MFNKIFSAIFSRDTRAFLKTQKSRLSKFLKFEFTPVNEHFNNFV